MMYSSRNARALGAGVALLALGACGGRDDSSLRADSSVRTVAGDVSLDSATAGTVFHGVKYPLTSDNYRKWIVAQAALDSLPEPVSMPRVDLRDPTDDDIDRTVEFLSKDAAAGGAIERSGLNVRDFVLTSIALGQAFNFANDALVPTENRTFVRSNRDEIVRVRQARAFHVLDEDDDDDRDEARGEERHKEHKERHHHHRGDHGKHKGHDR